MREQVLWRKVARIIMRLAERLQISPERALAIFSSYLIEKREQKILSL